MTPGEPRLDDAVLLFIGFIIVVVLWEVRRIVPVRVRRFTLVGAVVVAVVVVGVWWRLTIPDDACVVARVLDVSSPVETTWCPPASASSSRSAPEVGPALAASVLLLSIAALAFLVSLSRARDRRRVEVPPDANGGRSGNPQELALRGSVGSVPTTSPDGSPPDDPLPEPAWAALPPKRRSTVSNVIVFSCAIVAILVAGGSLWATVGRHGSGHIPAPANATAEASIGEAKLLIRLDVGQDYGEADSGITTQHVADYLSDGTVIRVNSPANSNLPYPVPPGTLERNTLSSTGMATLRALLAQDADLLAEPMEIKHWGDVIINTFVLQRPDGSRYIVSAPDIDSPYSDKTWVPDPATERLGALAKALADPATMAGADGLTRPTWEPYKPAKTAVFVLTLPIEGKYDPTGINPHNEPDLDDVGWPFVGDPDTFGGAFTNTPHSGIFSRATTRCAFLPSADVESAIAGTTHAGNWRFAVEQIASGTFFESNIWRWSARSETTGVLLIALALMPEDVATSCIDAVSY